MRGYAVRAELTPLARKMRQEGMIYREIAAELGVGTGTVAEWITDPQGAKRKARKEGYRGKCGRCGRPTDGSDPRSPSKHCHVCAPDVHRRWTRAAVIEAIRAAASGDVPPLAEDNRSLASAARLVFGSWNKAVEGAGFEPRLAGHYPRPGTRPEVCVAMAKRRAEGATWREIASEWGVSPQAARYRAGKADVSNVVSRLA